MHSLHYSRLPCNGKEAGKATLSENCKNHLSVSTKSLLWKKENTKRIDQSAMKKESNRYIYLSCMEENKGIVNNPISKTALLTIINPQFHYF